MRPFRTLFLLVALPCFLPACQRSNAVDARLQRPQELADAATRSGAKNIFTNPRARALLGESTNHPALAPATPRDAAAALKPKAWRRLDREKRFDAVLLAGPVGEYQPLLTHLVDSPDFRLVRVDNWGALFVRGEPAPYHAPDPGDVPHDFSRASERGGYLARTALMLQAIGQDAAARAYSDAAIDAAPKEAIVHVGAAALALARKDYAPAVAESRRALELNPHDLGALEITARTLSEAGAPDQAWAVADELKTRADPDDMNVLFLHAQLANAAHAYAAEQDSLERLVKLAEAQGLPTVDYRVYLGQCYAHQGLARPALEQLERAAKEPDLTDQQRADIDTAITTVRQRAGALSN
jgi:tetratricopeptide (TPR) repeat protein